MSNQFVQLAKASYQNEKLTRPDWTEDVSRPEGPLWLNKNENLDPELNEKIKTLISKVNCYAINTYPELAKVYKKIALMDDVSPKNLLLTHGSDGAIRTVFDVFISPGDKVLHTSPTFAMYDVYSKIYGAEQILMPYDYSPNGPVLDFSKFIKLIQTHRPKLICLPNPDSPTGTVLSKENFETLLKTSQEFGSLLLIDEAYFPFYPETQIKKILKNKNLLVCRSFSKAWGAAGLRVGYLCGNEELITILHKSRPMYELSTFSSELIYLLLDCRQDIIDSVARLEEGKKYFLKQMLDLGFGVTESYGNFIHINFKDRTDKIASALKSVVLYRTEFNNASCLRGFSRFSLGTKKQFENIVDKIKSVQK